MRLQLLAQFVQFSFPGQLFCLHFSFICFLLVLEGIPQYTHQGHATDHQKTKCHSNQDGPGEEGIVVRCSSENQNEQRTAYKKPNNSKNKTKNKYKSIFILL